MEHRLCVVTGAARGIGRATAEALAATGADVALLDVIGDEVAAAAAELSEAGYRARAYQADLRDPGSVTAALADIVKDSGAIDVLVNNAGWERLMPFVESDEELWEEIIAINFKGVLRTVHAVLPAMIEQGWGRIINVASDAGRVGSTNEAVYSGAKGGVIAFTKTIAREVARSNVTANSVCPGPTDTPLLRSVAGHDESSEKIITSMTRAVAMRRLGRPEEVAAAIRFLASDDASFITGQVVSVSGGLTMC